jgi:hypothetical protein
LAALFRLFSHDAMPRPDEPDDEPDDERDENSVME